ncbi:MAG TPA: glucose 1-dehydrogenase [Edaphocola sp.]|nr:glucose 1-dehydrogenase [Edaphocola sp.]
MGRLANKIAIITGAVGGIGLVTVKEFLKEGAKVVFTDLYGVKGKILETELGENSFFIRQDVTKEEDWAYVLEQTEMKFGSPDILVNNAGIVSTKLIADLSLEEYQKTIDVNQTSVFLGMKHVLPFMKKKPKGAIVNISSIEGLMASPMVAAYVASKFAVRGLTKAAALEFAPYNIRVNSIHPGIVDTPMIHQPEVVDAVKAMLEMVPLKRAADPKEVAAMIVFLASDDSGYSTGSEFVLDGGVTPF